MTAPSDSTPGTQTRPELADEIRNTLTRLDTLDREKAGYIKTLAFILYRVALADDDLCEQEIARMEQILVEHAALSRPEAVLTVEIAKHCGEIADCGCSYTASRRLRSLLNTRDGCRIHHFLQSVAAADGRVRGSEMAQIRQIVAELGLSA